MQSLVVLVVLALFVTLGSASPYAGVTKATYNGSMTHYPDTNGYGTTSYFLLLFSSSPLHFRFFPRVSFLFIYSSSNSVLTSCFHTFSR